MNKKTIPVAALRVEMPDGSRIERAYRIEADKKVPKGNWQWAVYNPARRASGSTSARRTVAPR